ncbi:hypothetical protein L837_0076 [Mycobacterium avium MAV_061107_1842]|nr:hypothetical protein L837_0076 [Mycobacterium avium MAV_061107_1842]
MPAATAPSDAQTPAVRFDAASLRIGWRNVSKRRRRVG